MPNYSKSTRQRVADINLGIRVDRAATHLVHSGTETLFTVSVGKVLMNLLVGECTVDVGGAVNATLAFDPDTGDTANLAGLTAWTAINAGDVITITGLLTDTTLPAVQAGSARAQNYPVVLVPGILTLLTSTTVDGTFKWSLFYVPIDEGAYVTATIA
ncbi:MAG: hypothetical protein KJ954_13795 [Alphaproteobacteria bacterium]|nr:hypothetical protein [Alphaproteobacteria bacterium]